MIYLTGSVGVAAEKHLNSNLIGYLRAPGGGRALQPSWTWAADNGCFGKGWPGIDKWLDWLRSYTDEERSRCLFATAPDVVGDHSATVARSAPLIPVIRSLGYKAAFVAQDGMTADGSDWDFDVLFIGGSTAWKLGSNAKSVIAESIRRGIPVHVGRINSQKRLIAFAALGCSSADGTFLAYGPETNLPKLLSWITHLDTHPPLFEMQPS